MIWIGAIYIGLDAGGVDPHGAVQIRIGGKLPFEGSGQNGPEIHLSCILLTLNSAVAQPPNMKEGSPISLKTES